MNNVKKYISEGAATETLQRIYSNSPDSDVVRLGDIFIATERTAIDEGTNRNWLANKMTQLRYHNLINPVYRFDGRKRLDGVQLTIKGKRALGRLDADLIEDVTENTNITPLKTGVSSLTLDDILEAVATLQEKHSGWDIQFTVNPKKKEAKS